jgi:hypothetical protein
MTANLGFPSGLPGDRLIRGTFARWTETANWTDRDGLPLPTTMLVVGYTTVLQMWKNHKAEVISQHPLPDPKELNDKIPVSEWELDKGGKPTPPWKLTYVIYMVDPQSGAIFTYANNTFGAMLAYSNLEEQIGVMRMLRGEHVFPIVRLEKRPMKTNFGMKTRPHLHPIEWHARGGAGAKLATQSSTPQISAPATTPTLPTPSETTTIPAPAPSATTPSAAPASPVLENMQPVKPVTVAELIADELPPWA